MSVLDLGEGGKTNPDADRLLTLQEASKLVGGLSPAMLRSRIRAGLIPAVLVGRSFLVTRRAVDDYLVGEAERTLERVRHGGEVDRAAGERRIARRLAAREAARLATEAPAVPCVGLKPSEGTDPRRVAENGAQGEQGADSDKPTPSTSSSTPAGGEENSEPGPGSDGFFAQPGAKPPKKQKPEAVNNPLVNYLRKHEISLDFDDYIYPDR